MHAAYMPGRPHRNQPPASLIPGNNLCKRGARYKRHDSQGRIVTSR